jgi:hypothetical protein
VLGWLAAIASGRGMLLSTPLACVPTFRAYDLRPRPSVAVADSSSLSSPARMAPSSNFLGPPELLPLENAEFAVLRVLEHFKEVPYLLKQVSGHIGDVPAKWAAWPMCMATDEVILMKLGPRRGL